MKIAPHIAEKFPRLLEAVNFTVGSREGGSVSWENNVSESLSIVDAETDKLTWEFKIEHHHCNQLSNLHGGCVATLIDMCSSVALLVAGGKQWQIIGISTDLSISYLRGIAEGETIHIVCEVQRVGKTLASIYTKIYDGQNRLSYTGSHTKFNIDSRL
ncbi:HotDog domain-containing protein [Mucor mucedo]|uniref:HotDog domain-containing protein n=1 Tax=Mucor mucedo TaxID=29922 RepID=UPI00221E7180|nr:HotDog domain-containing protein [Mucor mucedo]KAI7892310.1 HotDog domain-containing protein [Mucor mucedo]